MSYAANRLRKLREERNLNQSVVADEVGISRAMLSNYESGQTPSLRNGIKLADFYHVSLDYIFGRSSERSTTDGGYLKSFSTLTALAPNSSPDASEIADLATAAIAYMVSGAPCGEQPLTAWRDFMRSLTKCLNAAVQGSNPALIDSANAATLAALEIAKMPIHLMENQERS